MNKQLQSMRRRVEGVIHRPDVAETARRDDVRAALAAAFGAALVMGVSRIRGRERDDY